MNEASEPSSEENPGMSGTAVENWTRSRTPPSR